MARRSEELLYRTFARHYDRIYAYKDTRTEVDFILAMMRGYGAVGRDILDLACGTGRHARLLVSRGCRVWGIDRRPEVLRIARRKVPSAVFRAGDMRTVRLSRRFDAVLCMFTALNYVTRKDDLVRTLRNFARHLKDGGILVFDVPSWRRRSSANRVEGDVIDKNTAVLYVWSERGRLTVGTLYWIVKEDKASRAVRDVHVIRSWRMGEIRDALRRAGLEWRVFWDFSLRKRAGRRPVFVCWSPAGRR